MALQDREKFLLRVLGRRRYLDTDMLARLFYWDRAARTCRWHLEQMKKLGLLDRATFTPLVGTPEGPRPYVYWLTAKAARQVDATFGEQVSLPHGRKRGEAYDPTVEHILAVNSLYVSLVELWRDGGNLAHLDWRDEWSGAMLKIPLAGQQAESQRRGARSLHFRPDAFVKLALVTRGELPPIVAQYAPQTPMGRWQTLQNWPDMFPDFSSARTEGVEKAALWPAFVESDMGKSSRGQLLAKLAKYRFVRRRPDRWAPHYGVPLVGPEKKPLWPGMLVLCQTERRMHTLASIFTHPKSGYEGWVLLACFDWDRGNSVTGARMGLVKGPVWYDPRSGQSRLSLLEALDGLSGHSALRPSIEMLEP